MEPDGMAKATADQPRKAANENLDVEQDALALDALAKGVLARDFRPRVGSVRRLAEGVLALQDELKQARKKSRKLAKAAKSDAPKPAKKKKKKLAKIPGQKKDK